MFYRIKMFLLVVFIMVVLSVSFRSEASEDFTYRVNFLPMSKHVGSTSATNERHKGIGMSVTLPNDLTYGLMHYKNSYGDNGWLVSVSTELSGCYVVCLGVGVGYAPAYAKSNRPTVVGWFSFRYEWVVLLAAPDEVTALMLSIPFD